ncbi:MAG: hypothetical protein RLZZ293_561 [Pseudomonadota bacterium]
MNKKNSNSQYLAHDDHCGHVHSDNSHNNLAHHDHGEHGHSHDFAEMIRESSGSTLFWCLILTFSFSLIEGVAGWIIKSIALQTDAVHMLTDAAGLLIAYIANRISRRPANISLTFGYGKAEVLGALINCIFTSILTIWLLVEVIERFFNPVTVEGASLFIVATIGFIVNGLIVWLLSRNSHSLNTKAALIHALGDLLGALVAIIAGVVIYFTNWSIVDPLLSLIVIVLLLISNYKIMKKSAVILMAGVPEHLDYEQIGGDLRNIKGIVEVHDLHVWYISANQAALAAHVIACKLDEWPIILQDCQKILLENYSISHVTLQAEFDDIKCKQIGCCT